MIAQQAAAVKKEEAAFAMKVKMIGVPSWTAAYKIRDLLTEELPKLNSEEPPIIRDTAFDEQGIYFITPPEVEERPGGKLVLTVYGSIWTWDGTKYCSDNARTDVLDIELLPHFQGTEVEIVPHVVLKIGLVEYIETLITGLFTDPGTMPTEKLKPRGPTARTQARAEVFKKLKDAHPEWSQAKVAMEAQRELNENVTADTVRNAYRAMGWEWERGDRIR